MALTTLNSLCFEKNIGLLRRCGKVCRREMVVYVRAVDCGKKSCLIQPDAYAHCLSNIITLQPQHALKSLFYYRLPDSPPPSTVPVCAMPCRYR
jgi:hypothetical protein